MAPITLLLILLELLPGDVAYGVTQCNVDSNLISANRCAPLTVHAEGSVAKSPMPEHNSATSSIAASAPLPPAPPDLLPAFPGAEGYGALALNDIDRSKLEVLTVTNTNNSGAGSLRNAIARSDPTRLSIIIFRTAGTIELSSRLDIAKSYIYIAGQTAPGDGIQLHAAGGIVMFVDDDALTTDVIIRYIRLRGDKILNGPDLFTARSGANIILDHISANYGNDEVVTFTSRSATREGKDIRNLTIQRSIIGPGLRPHSTGSLFKGADDGTTIASNVSLHHNLLPNSAHRSPRVVAVSSMQVVNNVVYNWKNWVGGVEAGEGNNPCSVDFINNYWKSGPWTGRNSDQLIRHDDDTALCVIHAAGNIAEPFQQDASADQQNLFKYRYSERPLPSSAFSEARQADPVIAITELSAADAYNNVLADVGANARLDCDGSWLPASDRLDQLLLDQVRNGTGPATDTENDHPADYGGVPVLASGTPCADTDADGMPDAFETRFDLNPSDPSDSARDADGDGYTNLEEYLGGTTP